MNTTAIPPLPDATYSAKPTALGLADLECPINPTATSMFARTIVIARPITGARRPTARDQRPIAMVPRWEHGGINE